MPLAKQRSAYKGQFTTLKREIDNISRDPEILKRDGMLEALFLHQQNLGNIERKYIDTQLQIINAAPADKVQAEKDDYEVFLKDTASTMLSINRFIAKWKVMQTGDGSASGRSSATPGGNQDISALIQLIGKQIEESKLQREQNTETINSLMSEIKTMSQRPVVVNQRVVNNGEGRQDETFTISSHRKHDAIKIKPFSGNYNEWQSFRNLFESIIMKDDNLTKTEKMQYLKTLVVDDAAPIIESLKLCDENFDVAWSSLTKEFDSPSPIVSAYMNEYFNLPPMATKTMQEVQKLQRKANSILLAMDAMKQNSRDALAIYPILHKTDEETRLLWAAELKKEKAPPTWEQFNDFLINRGFQLRMTEVDDVTEGTESTKKAVSGKSKKQKSKATSLAANEQMNCRYCKAAPHKLFRCKKFLALDGVRRLAAVRDLRICENCLLEAHKVEHCSYSLCNVCNGKHNRLLHDAIVIANATSLYACGNLGNAEVKTSLLCKEVKPILTKVILATIMVRIVDSAGNQHLCRALLDCGSQINIISTRLCQLLHLKTRSANISIEGVGTSTQSAQSITDVVVRPRMETSNYALPMTCIVMKRVTSEQPNWDAGKMKITIPEQFVLADPTWQRTQPIDLLIGAEYFCEILSNDTHVLGPQLPIMKNTVFGWVLIGACSEESVSAAVASCNNASVQFDDLERSMQRLWELEGIELGSPTSIEEDKAEEIYTETTSRDQDGRYIVQMPFKANIADLESNLSTARRQLFLLEAKLNKNPELREQYNQIIEEYLEKGIVEVVPYDQLNEKSFYMPHHCVVREEAVSTKVRIVFNASSKSRSGLSLNDTLLVGPTVQPSLISTLLKFRLYLVALTCDIIKMYLQFLMHEPHRNYQRFLWRTSSDGRIKHLRGKAVLFGTSAAPFLAIRSLDQLRKDEGQNYPKAANLVKENFYVDDCLVSFPTVEEAIEAKNQLVELLSHAKLELSKFKSNHPALLAGTDDDSQLDLLKDDEVVKTLGMRWCPKTDMFQYKTNATLEVATKRNMLSILARIYDPIGLVSPLTTVAKCIIQELWKLSIDWDIEVTGDIKNRWMKFMDTLPHIEDLRIPRWISTLTEVVKQELHCFGDASKKAHGACIYFVTEDAAGNRCSRLIAAKSKVNPMKYQENDKQKDFTIPKGELCGALLSTKLATAVAGITGVSQCYFWLDATAVLFQIHRPSRTRDIFVKNVVKKILEVTTCEQWRHVGTKENPADLASRGASPHQLMESDLRWNGPSWLTLSEENWPQKFDGEEDINESSLTLTVNTPNNTAQVVHPIFEHLMTNLSTYSKIRRVLARVVQVIAIWKTWKLSMSISITQSRSKKERKFKWLPLQCLRTAEMLVIQWDQDQHLSHVIRAVKSGKLNSDSKLTQFRKLRPFIDEQGTLRVGGRLGLAKLAQDAKHPKILPKSRLSKLIAEREHLIMKHSGPQLTLASLRQRFWPVDGRRLTRKVSNDCIRCIKVNPPMLNQIMGDLPEDRVTTTEAFDRIGVDFAGPIYIKHGVRKSVRVKAYIAVFVCFVTKAIHLEAVGSLLTQDFIKAFRRMTSRRGVPTKVCSDNGKTFVGADKELKRLWESENHQNRIHQFTIERNIEWNFLPPRAPHQGGLHEAAVKGFKHHFIRVVGDKALDFDDLQTVLCEIEAVLNSRPLVPMSDNVDDLRWISPSKLISLKDTLTQLPDPPVTHLKLAYLDRWHMMQRIYQDLTIQWKKEYLSTLQIRSKWSKQYENLKEGDFVLLSDSVLPSTKWATGRVTKVFPGGDGNVRVAEVRTSRGTYRRAIQQLVRLPIEDDNAV